MKLTKIPIKGKSMSPTLQSGDLLIVHISKKIPNQMGDISLFLDDSSKEMVTHRIINKEGKTKGDSSFYNDEKSIDKLGVVMGYINHNNQITYWGENGQFLKTQIAFFSKYAVKKNIFRHLFLFVLITFSKFSLLLYVLTNKHHKKKLLRDDPSLDV